MTSINKLPEEIRENIYGRLNLRDQVNVTATDRIYPDSAKENLNISRGIKNRKIRETLVKVANMYDILPTDPINIATSEPVTPDMVQNLLTEIATDVEVAENYPFQPITPGFLSRDCQTALLNPHTETGPRQAGAFCPRDIANSASEAIQFEAMAKFLYLSNEDRAKVEKIICAGGAYGEYVKENPRIFVNVGHNTYLNDTLDIIQKNDKYSQIIHNDPSKWDSQRALTLNIMIAIENSGKTGAEFVNHHFDILQKTTFQDLMRIKAIVTQTPESIPLLSGHLNNAAIANNQAAMDALSSTSLLLAPEEPTQTVFMQPQPPLKSLLQSHVKSNLNSWLKLNADQMRITLNIGSVKTAFGNLRNLPHENIRPQISKMIENNIEGWLSLPVEKMRATDRIMGSDDPFSRFITENPENFDAWLALSENEMAVTANILSSRNAIDTPHPNNRALAKKLVTENPQAWLNLPEKTKAELLSLLSRTDETFGFCNKKNLTDPAQVDNVQKNLTLLTLRKGNRQARQAVIKNLNRWYSLSRIAMRDLAATAQRPNVTEAIMTEKIAAAMRERSA